ncbi:hypothetical protein P154DRAFT_547164 [Amniculicola lignicola CBS 123094]|uniref:CENP-Q, a CENPA-CAD centromere complex subunit-domain-containing protein n=1 Tax=Amniculicola lignicola CBS 123094 TaxID=1392246 RepID=A0A6A5W959_9PLEO|nr:hypothetical protein P154DRAFT_547164 [Amniculicola lignicola CBS 123094]
MDSQAPTRSRENGVKRRAGRPSKSTPPSGRAAAAREAGNAKRRGRPRKSDHAGEGIEKSGARRSSQKQAVRPAQPTEPTAGRKRKARDIDDDELAEDGPNAQKQLQLAPSKRRIPREAISQWPDMTASVMEGIKSVLQSAKNATVRSRRDQRKQNEAYEVLTKVVSRLERKLSHAKMPPNAKDVHFNLERLTERNAELHRQLATARHANQLLADQVERATDALEQAQSGLQQAKTAALTWEQKREAQERKGKIHPMLVLPEDFNINGDGPDDIGMRNKEPADTALFDTPDDDLGPLLEQLRRSLLSLQGSHDQVDGIDEAMHGAQAALDNLLFKHTSAQQYDAL